MSLTGPSCFLAANLAQLVTFNLAQLVTFKNGHYFAIVTALKNVLKYLFYSVFLNINQNWPKEGPPQKTITFSHLENTGW